MILPICFFIYVCCLGRFEYLCTNNSDQMNYEQFILTVNSSSIILLVMLALVLLHATRFRSGSGYAAAIIVLPTVPVYLYNMSRMLGWHDFSLFMLPIAFSVNTLQLPLLWFFARHSFDSSFRLFHYKNLLHFLPMIIFFVLILSVPVEERMQTIVQEMSGTDTWIGDLNTTVIMLQLILYYIFIFRFLRRSRREVGDTQCDSEWVEKIYVARFLSLYGACFIVVMVSYAIWPRTDAWLIQILNVIAMFYLVHHSIANPSMARPLMSVDELDIQASAVSADSSNEPAMQAEEMQTVCERAIRYLSETKAYLRPDISLPVFAKEVDIPQRTLSRSINGHLHCNFFTFINGMRVEEAKRCLLTLETSGFNIDSIYSECGFRSRSTFFMVFKKIEGKSPAAWLEQIRQCG